MEKNILEYIGKNLYQTNILKEMKRYLVFRTRCRLHSDLVNDLLDFFSANEHREQWLMGNPSFVAGDAYFFLQGLNLGGTHAAGEEPFADYGESLQG